MRLSGPSQKNLEREGCLFDGYLVAADTLLCGRAASDQFGRELRRHGIEGALQRLNGAYWYVVRKGNLVWFGVDHFGGGSLFYQLEPEPVLYEDPFAEVANPSYFDSAFCCLLASGYTLDQDTVYAGVRECSSGVLYEYDTASGSLQEKTWFKFNLNPEKEYEPASLEAALMRSLPQLGDGGRSYLLPLSGGLDSRTILGVALQRNLPLETFSYGLRSAADYDIPEKICSELEVSHAVFPTAAAPGEDWFGTADMEDMVRCMHLARSLPEESDWLPVREFSTGRFVVCPGHSGDWLAGSWIDPRLYRTKTLERLVEYILDRHFGLTAISSGDFAELLRVGIRESLLAIMPDCGEEPIACAERWNLEHRQKKYIVNSTRKYRHLGLQTYLPFFDRELMSIFMHLKTQYRVNQRAYIDLLRTQLYTGRLEILRRIENTRRDLDPGQPGDLGRESLRERLHQRLREIDRGKYRKRFLLSSMQGYDDPAAMLTSRGKAFFLRQKVKHAFPLLYPCAEQLRGLNCPESARHVEWILGQQVSQMNPAGLFVCAFLPYLLQVE